MFRKNLILITALLGLAILLPGLAQEEEPRSAIDEAIENKDWRKADSMVRRDLALFFSNKNLDTIAHYLNYVGILAFERGQQDQARVSVFGLIDTLLAQQAKPFTVIKACRQAAEFFAGKGMNNDGYESCQVARKEAEKLTDRKELEIAQCEYNLGVYAQRLGNVRLSQTHHRESLRIRESNEGA